jgi:hypothetical protein
MDAFERRETWPRFSLANRILEYREVFKQWSTHDFDFLLGRESMTVEMCLSLEEESSQ